MDEHPFFKLLKRFNLILLALLLLGLFVGMVYGLVSSLDLTGERSTNKSSKLSDSPATADELADFHLSGLTSVNPEVQYIRLISDGSSKRISSASYGSGATHNLLFLVGPKLQSHWLLERDDYQLETVDLLKTSDKDKKVVAIYYQVRNEDADNNQQIDHKDPLAIALSTPTGEGYQELDKGLTAVIDHQVNTNATELTLLVQIEQRYLIKKYDIKSGRLLASKEISRSGK